MPGIYLSDPLATSTDTTSQTVNVPDAPAITSVAIPGDFQLGSDTCGFTSESTSGLSSSKTVSCPEDTTNMIDPITVTCSYGSECTNVGSYRGCCISGGEDCISTMYTTCLDYGQAPVPEDCGNHTLCWSVLSSDREPFLPKQRKKPQV